MKEVRDLGILLFGKKIALQENSAAGEFDGGGFINSHRDASSMDEERRSCLDDGEETEQDHLLETHKESKTEEMAESTNSKASPESDNNPKTPSIDEDTAAAKDENDQSDTTNSDQKTLKKPDKTLPCPRCNSMDTKFCYYNNYNVNQPRHFCKSCQRYWTCGGTMRNVPVGAGRRKNKNSVPHGRYITISEALQAAQFDSHDGLYNPTNRTNGNVLNFGSDSQLFESMTSALKLADRKGSQVVSCRMGENGDDCSSGSSVTTSNSMVEPKMQNIHGFAPPQVPCLPPGVAWPYPWNPAVPFPALCPPPGLPMQFYPSPYWNCSVPGGWNMPWLPHLSNEKAQGFEPNSPQLGKRSREEEPQKVHNPEDAQKKQKNSVLTPKTLRFDDPDEAAKSSIWATLGIKNDSINRGGLFKAFQAKGEEKNHRVANSPLLQANPAALSRSLFFQERA